MDNPGENEIVVDVRDAEDADEVSSIESSHKSEELYKKHEIYLRSLLPEEVWRHILFMIKDPDDLLRCVNSSPYFWELEQENRVLYLFPKVMKILAIRYEPRDFEVKKEIEKNMGSDDVEREHENSQRKRNARAEWRRTVFNCRLVCSTWNQAVENIYATPLLIGIREYAEDFDSRPLENTLHFGNERAKWNSYIWDLESAQSFLQHYEQSHNSGENAPQKNPVFGRYLALLINEPERGPENFKEYKNTITKILTLFGRHIWYCYLIVGKIFTNLEDYLELRQWLSLMSNLKFIRMLGPQVHDSMPLEISQRNPLPVLEKLDNATLCMTGGLIATEFLRRNGGHLHSLKMRHINGGVDVNSVGSLLSNLKSYSSEYSTSGDAMLEKFARGWKQLAKLEFKSSSFKRASEVLKSASFPSDVLTDLSVQLHDESASEEEIKALRLNLPNLRRLRLLIGDPFSLSFAVPMAKSLEHLEIACLAKDTIHSERFEKKMIETNIWSVFGKLKTFMMTYHYHSGKIEFTLYTRDGNKVAYEL